MKLPEQHHQKNVEYVNGFSLEEIFQFAASGYGVKHPEIPIRECFETVDCLSVAECKVLAVFYLDHCDCLALGFDDFDLSEN